MHCWVIGPGSKSSTNETNWNDALSRRPDGRGAYAGKASNFARDLYLERRNFPPSPLVHCRAVHR